MTMTIEITPRCHAAIIARSSNPAYFVDTSITLSNGNREIVVQDSTAAALIRHRLPGESLSDTIERLCAVTGRPLH